MCETFGGVVASSSHQNIPNYVCERSGSSFNSLCKNLERWAVTQRTSNNPQNWPNWGGGGGGGGGWWVLVRGWALAWRWSLAQDNTGNVRTIDKK